MVLEGVNSFIVFALALSGLIFVHELGHFLMARLARVNVEEFGLGFPPRLIGLVRDANNRWRLVLGPRTPKPAELGGPRTIYSFNLIPIGGFVRLTGEDGADKPGSLANASRGARIAVLAGGAAFNLIFAFLVFALGFRLGWPDRVRIVGVAEASPAQTAGLRTGDILLTAEGREIHYSQHLIDVTYSRLGQPIGLTLDRDGQAMEITVTPRTTWPSGQGPMGVELDQAVIITYAWPQAALRAGQEIVDQVQLLIRLPARLLRNEVPLEVARPCGPVCINDLTREAVEMAQAANAWFPVIQLVGLISVALAVSNLLPLPALDGGRILFVLLEMIRGRRLDPAREGMIHLVGIAMLLALMVVITYQDIFNPVIPR